MKRVFRQLPQAAGWGLGLLLILRAAEFGNPVDDIFAPKPPTPPGAGTPPMVLAPRSAGPAAKPPRLGGTVLPPRRKRPAPPPPQLVLEEGDRVLLLGELFEATRTLGFLETRLISQEPDKDVRCRNLGWPEVGLATVEPSDETPPAVAKRLRAAAAFHPTVALVSVGKGDSLAGVNTNRFAAAFEDLLDRLVALNPDPPTRVVVVAPYAFEDRPNSVLNAKAANEQLAPYIMVTYRAATNRSLPFVNLFGYSLWDARQEQQRAGAAQTEPQYRTTDGRTLTAYGCWRLTFGLESILRWTRNTWRWGLMPDNTFRDGGFGMEIFEHERTQQSALVRCRSHRLPTPNPPGWTDLRANSKPQCYIQLPGLSPGRYELQVDGRPVLSGDHQEWGRYEVIAKGPEWEQAEKLRQAVVRKNRQVATWLEGFDDPAARAAAEAEIEKIEARIAKLRVPPKRLYQIRRVAGTRSQPAPKRVER